MIKGSVIALIGLFLAVPSLRAQNSPNGPPGPTGNPTPPNNGNPPPVPPSTPTPTPVPPASPEGRSDPIALARLRRTLARHRTATIFDSAGNVSHSLLVPSIKETANVAGLSSAMTQSAQGASTATDNNLEQRMAQIRNAAYGKTNISLYEAGKELPTESESVAPKFGAWLTGTGLFTRSEGTTTRAGTLTAGVDTFLSRHMVIGLLGAYVYSRSEIPGITGHMLANAEIGGVYFGAWTGVPGLYLSLSGLVNHTDFSLINASSPHLFNLTGFGSVGYQTRGTWSFGALASVQFDNANTNRFTLTGLQLHPNVSNTVQTRIGGTVEREIQMGSRHLDPKLQLMWEHRYFGNAMLDTEYVGIPDTRVSVGKGAKNLDSLWGSASVDYQLSDSWALQTSYSFDVGEDFVSQQVDLGFHLRF